MRLPTAFGHSGHGVAREEHQFAEKGFAPGGQEGRIWIVEQEDLA
jgi:hypothetical protein